MSRSNARVRLSLPPGMRRPSRLLCAVSLLVVVVAAPSTAAPTEVPVNVVTTAPAAQFHGYTAPVVVTEKSGRLTYVNLDIVQHDVVQDVEADGVKGPKRKPWCKAFKKRACPVFWSPKIGVGQETEVLGLESVKPGQTYTFYCTLHPGMQGTLVVRP